MWDVWIDTGGTFTDALASSPQHELRRAKVLSSSVLRLPLSPSPAVSAGRTTRVQLASDASPAGASWPGGFLTGLVAAVPGRAAEATVVEHAGTHLTLSVPLPLDDVIECRAPFEAPILAAHTLLGVPCAAPLPPINLRLATTRGTNALLQGRLAPVALFITEGLEDLLLIGDQTRPDLFALDIRRPAPAYRVRFSLAHRLDAAGSELRALDERLLRADARAALDAGCTHAAVAVLHAWRAPEAEARVASILCEAGFAHVSCSSALTPEIGLLPRAQTAVINAALAPEIERFVGRIRSCLAPGSTLRVMTSAGSLSLPEALAPKDTLLSGPAGGYVGAIHAAQRAGVPRVLTFDMGGTSTDVARSEGTRHLVSRHSVGSSSILAPAVAVESVAAGGGSICSVHAGALRVGPESAGASPGPACYGAGGPLTITDVNLLLGRLHPARFPFPLRTDHAQIALAQVLDHARAEGDPALTPDALLHAFRDLADDAIAAALRAISTRQGCDPRTYSLLSFGGAGGQHACAVAQRLGIREVIIPPDQSLLSAQGLGVTTLERIRRVQVLRLLEPDHLWLSRKIDDAVDAAASDLAADLLLARSAGRPIALEATLFVRAPGQEHSLPIDLPACGPRPEPLAPWVIARFTEAYSRLFAHPPSLGGPGARCVEVEAVRARAALTPLPDRPALASPSHPKPHAPAAPAAALPSPSIPTAAHVPAFERNRLAGEVTGPALIHEDHSLTVVEPGWTASPLACGGLRLYRSEAGSASTLSAPGSTLDLPLDVFAARLTSIAVDMGELLRRTAISVNIRERVDFSCAVLDASGDLVVNAPHVPVHLGALGVCVREVVRTLPLQPGDVAITNHPAFGGSHLPDVTLIAPAHHDGRLLGYVAARAHHAEIGGVAPGSMAAHARSLAEEACVIPPMRLVHEGGAAFDALERLLTTGPWPSRAPRDNIADARAALAACVRGREALSKLARAIPPGALSRQFEALKARASERMRLALLRRGPFEAHLRERLDAGPEFRLRVSSDTENIHFDFTGTDPPHPSTLNATPAIVRSVIIYALRALLNEDASLNEGLMRRTRVVLPPSFLNPHFDADPARCPAVGAGNVETSQRLANALIRALGLAAESQGTMNNILIGGERWATYETLGGGAGAGPGFHGTSAIHTHMTNTRLTDPEVIESRFPLRIERFNRRVGSGGEGAWRGGDGLVRQYLFNAHACITLLTQRRERGPEGHHGASPGRVGRQCLLTADGSTHPLAPRTTCWVSAGDRLVIETPGGGGWGAKSE